MEGGGKAFDEPRLRGRRTSIMKHTHSIALSAFLLIPFSCQSPGESERLHRLFDREWEFRLTENPLLATSVGRHEFNDRLPSVTPEDYRRRTDFHRELLEALEAVDPLLLDRQDRTSLRVFEHYLRESVSAAKFAAYEIPLTVDSGFHISFARLPTRMPFRTAKDFENYIARLNAFPAYAGQHIDNMRRGLQRGMTLPRVVLEGYEATIAAQIVEEARDSVFHQPFKTFPPGVPEVERGRLRSAGEAAIRGSVVPAYRTFLAFMTEEYAPRARVTTAAADLPDGREYYRHRVRAFTTLDLSVDEIHQTGLDEVSRIQEEMRAVMKETGFRGDFAAFLEFLRTDSRFYAKTPEELLKQASFLAKKMDAKLPALFKTLPRLPYGIAPVPDHLAPKYTAGRYVLAPAGGTEPGYYWVNTYALESRPLYVLESLTLHEAVPGHHLQIALSQEQDGIPDFRRHSYFSAFGEGWGLYAERLGLEAGFYSDPYSNFGRLSYEMWRACRLVVDTGLHAKGWTRRQAMDYLASRTALSWREVRTETDRYISWPGQALAYKMGELTIRRLRREAEQALGPRFDLREFHDAVLSAGAVPLPVLEDLVADYMQRAEQPSRGEGADGA